MKISGDSNMPEIKAYVLCKVHSGTEREVCKAISEYSDIAEINIIYGEYDVIATINVETLQQLDFIVDKIRMIPSMTFTSTVIVGRKYKENGKTIAPDET
jgi:DNA-binding Lrp family transcriptional regulator